MSEMPEIWQVGAVGRGMENTEVRANREVGNKESTARKSLHVTLQSIPSRKERIGTS